MDVTTLVSRAANGDERAWEELVDRYGRLLRSVAGGLRMSGHDAADAAQSTWLALHEDIAGLRDPERVAGWLCAVMRRRCLHLLIRQRQEVPDDRTGQWLPPDDPAPTPDAVPAEAAAALWELVDRLPERERLVLRALFDETGRSYRETARLLGIPVGAVGPVRMRALRRLSGLLDTAGMGPDALRRTG
jgi:RNA polymerase sigma factor (sigma-70 family)